MPRTWIVLVVALVVLAAACTQTSHNDATTSTTTNADSDTLPGETTAPGTSDEEVVEGVPNDIVDFVSDLAVLLEDSPYADALAEDPEVFVATARLLCERLADDEPPFELLVDYLTLLSDGSPSDAPDEVLDLAGWLLGVGVGSFCPEYSDRLEGFER